VTSLQTLLQVVTEDYQARMLEQIASCVREGSETELHFACGLITRNGNLIDAQLTMKCDRTLGAFVIAVVKS